MLEKSRYGLAIDTPGYPAAPFNRDSQNMSPFGENEGWRPCCCREPSGPRVHTNNSPTWVCPEDQALSVEGFRVHVCLEGESIQGSQRGTKLLTERREVLSDFPSFLREHTCRVRRECPKNRIQMRSCLRYIG